LEIPRNLSEQKWKSRLYEIAGNFNPGEYHVAFLKKAFSQLQVIPAVVKLFAINLLLSAIRTFAFLSSFFTSFRGAQITRAASGT